MVPFFPSSAHHRLWQIIAELKSFKENADFDLIVADE